MNSLCPQPSVVAKEGPFPGPIPFARESSQYFLGREDEIQAIVARLHVRPITVLFSPSGTGKSSLLLAGVAQRLGKLDSAHTVYFAGSRGEKFLSALRKKILNEISRNRTIVDPGEDRALDDWLRRLADSGNSSMFLLLDQAETYLDKQDVAREIGKAIRDDETSTSFLIAIREEEIALLQSLERYVPDVFYNMFRLRALTPSAAVDVMRRAVERYNAAVPPGQQVVFEAGVAEGIVEEIRSGDNVDPLIFQIVAREYWLWAESGERIVRTDDIKPGAVDPNECIRKFVSRCLDGLDAAWRAAFLERADEFFTSSGHRLHWSEDRGADDSSMLAACGELTRSGLLTHLDTARSYLLCHDRIASVFGTVVERNPQVSASAGGGQQVRSRLRSRVPYVLLGYGDRELRSSPKDAVRFFRRAAVEAATTRDPESVKYALSRLRTGVMLASRREGRRLRFSEENVYELSWQIEPKDLSRQERDSFLLDEDAPDTPKLLPRDAFAAETAGEPVVRDLLYDQGIDLEI